MILTQYHDASDHGHGLVTPVIPQKGFSFLCCDAASNTALDAVGNVGHSHRIQCCTPKTYVCMHAPLHACMLHSKNICMLAERLLRHTSCATPSVPSKLSSVAAKPAPAVRIFVHIICSHLCPLSTELRSLRTTGTNK